MEHVDNEPRPARSPTRKALRIAGIYALFGVLWIALSDELVMALTADAAYLTRLQTFKGWLYVAITAALVFHLGRSALLRQQGFIDALRVRETDLERLNGELEQRVAQRTAELESAYKELEGFAYTVSHDLKAPLRGIDGYAQIVLEDYGDKLDAAGHRYLRKIRQGSDHMHRLIDGLLAYSRMERRQVEVRDVDLPAFVRLVLAERAGELQERHVRADVEVPELTVRADSDSLAMIVRNLLGNAIKFSAKTESPAVAIGARAAGERVVLWVRDNGIGFDMAFHDRIFEIFTRLERDEDYPGTGVGLALVRKAAARMGGRVWAESAPGRGATFFVDLPA